MTPGSSAYPTTPDSRYFVVRGRLWRCSNPDLSRAERARLVHELMDARRAVAHARRSNDAAATTAARTRVHAAKVALGERGDAWWSDDTPDYNRYLVKNSPYAEWWATAHPPR